MSGGKKKSSFQITSVTTDYEGPGSPGASDSPASPAPVGPPPRLPNGEPNPDSGGRGTPRNGSPPPGAPASRFRVVKLPQGLGEPYRRGRWTCVDVYERDLEPPNFGRLLEGIRGASGGTGGRSLDSRLELASLGISTSIPQPGLSQSPTSWLRPPPTSPGPQARSFTGGLGQLAGPGKAKVETPPLSASPPQQRPPGPGTGDSAQPLPSLRVDVESGSSAAGTPPLSRRRDGAVPLRMELVGPDESGKVRDGLQVQGDPGKGGGAETYRIQLLIDLYPGPPCLNFRPVLPTFSITYWIGHTVPISFQQFYTENLFFPNLPSIFCIPFSLSSSLFLSSLPLSLTLSGL